jgi:ribosome maturation factor RimP
MASGGRQALVDLITDHAEQVAAAEGMELVEIQFVGGGKQRKLRVTIDKPSGITLADCELISRQLGTVLDLEDVIPGNSYNLEVSSPGVERKLVRPKDYERFLGSKVRISLKEPIGKQRNFDGKLSGFADDTVKLEVAGGETMEFSLEQIKKANLRYDW